MIELNKEGKTIGEFVKVPSERIIELSKQYEGQNLFKILEDVLISETLTLNEKVAMLVQIGFNFGQNVLMSQAQQEAQALSQALQPKVH